MFTKSVVISLCAVIMVCSPANAQQPEKSEGGDRYDKIVRSLRSALEKPRVVPTPNGKYLVYSEDYNWEEHRRILDSIQSLVSNANEALPALVRGLADNEYCITVTSDRDVYRYSVASVCREILNDSLTRGYMNLIPPTQDAYVTLRRPEYVPLLERDLAKWYEEKQRHGVTLRELQIEAIEWVIGEVGDLPGVSKNDKSRSTQLLISKVNSLKAATKPLSLDSFWQGELRAVYTEERADEVRNRFQQK